MKMSSLKYLLIFSFAVTFGSCTELLYTSIDVLRPAKVTFARNANQLLIVNNTVVQPEEYGHKIKLLNERAKNISVSTDSLAIFCLSALTEDLGNKDFFSSITLLQNSINASNDFFTISPIPKDTVKALCSRYNSNAILSLDRIKVNDIINEYYSEQNTSYLDVLEVRYETFWTLQYPNDTPNSQAHYKDTIFWQSEEFLRKNALSRLPKRYDALIDGALYAGHNSTEKFIPYWDKEDRYFFASTNKLMKQGMDSVYTKNWVAATKYWEKLFNSTRNLTLKAQVSNNLAVLYEIQGDMEKANMYLDKAINIFNTLPFVDQKSFYLILDYQAKMNNRKKEIELLNKQI